MSRAKPGGGRAGISPAAILLALGLPLVLVLALIAITVRLDAPRAYVRVHDGELETAVATFSRPDGGPHVVLLAAVHVGEAAYYEKLQREADAADLCLYEGVAGLDSATRFGDAYAAIASSLGLVRQQDAMHRSRGFVHADLSWQECERALREAGAPVAEQVLDVDGVAAAASAAISRPLETRRLMATVFSRTSKAPDALTLVRDRYCATVLDAELKTRRTGTIALLFGAAHMADLEQRIAGRGYRLDRIDWQRAFDVEPASGGAKPR